MSESESFIEEVSEELRRDRLFALMRKWGWVPILLILAIVGYTAWHEYTKAQARAEAEAKGDALLAALEAEDRGEALAGLEAEGDLAAVVALLQAAEAVSNEDPAAAADLLLPVAEDGALPLAWRHLAGLKAAMLGEAGLPQERRTALLEELAEPGAPFAQLAQEQQIMMLIEAGKPEEALSRAREMTQQAGLTQGLQQRLSQVIVALGGETSEG